MRGKSILTILLILLFGYLFIVGVMTVFQNQLIFQPSTRMIDSPERLGMPWSEYWIETDDGVQIHGWMIGEPEENTVIVYSHGNAGNISGRVDIAASIARQGAAVFLYDYRGYGKSEGSPSEKGIYSDGKAAVHFLKKRLNIPADRIVFYGRSLGGAVAARQSADFKGAGLVLDSAFLSGKEIASDIYPFIPGFLVPVRFPVDVDLQQANVKHVMIIHAKNDRIIPFRHGEVLHRIVNEDSTKSTMFVELRGGHNTGFTQSKELFKQKWSVFLSKIEENR